MNTGNARNRGYLKIKGAASAFDFVFKNKIVLDIGSSTGGFTEYALEHGAKKVIAVEKGTNQMKAPLRTHPKVALYEKTDIFAVQASCPKTSQGKNEKITYIPTPDLILADVSFLSLTKVLKYAKINLSRSDTEFLVMLKPQFEATPKELTGGIVKNESIRRKIIKNFEQWLSRNGFVIIKKRDNALKGKHGNTERFYWLKIATKLPPTSCKINHKRI